MAAPGKRSRQDPTRLPIKPGQKLFRKSYMIANCAVARRMSCTTHSAACRCLPQQMWKDHRQLCHMHQVDASLSCSSFVQCWQLILEKSPETVTANGGSARVPFKYRIIQILHLSRELT